LTKRRRSSGGGAAEEPGKHRRLITAPSGGFRTGWLPKLVLANRLEPTDTATSTTRRRRRFEGDDEKLRWGVENEETRNRDNS
jgi:hypothetical protein